MDTDTKQLEQKIKRELADFLGVDTEDIENDTTLRFDLHMDSLSLTDFMEIMSTAGFETQSVDLTEIETFEELVEALTARQ